MRLGWLVIVVGATVTAPFAAAQEYDDPAVSVCELLVRPEFEIEKNIYRRVAASVVDQKVVLDIEWAVAGAKPNPAHVECAYRESQDGWVLDLEISGLSARPGYRSISVSGLYPIRPDETALQRSE
jgi:hypothetical protein